MLQFSIASHTLKVSIVPMTSVQGRGPRNAPKSADDWNRLAAVLERHYGDKYRAAACYLRDLASQTIGHHTPLAGLPWHEGAVLGALPDDAREYEPHDCVLAALSPSVPLRAIWRRQPRPP